MSSCGASLRSMIRLVIYEVVQNRFNFNYGIEGLWKLQLIYPVVWFRRMDQQRHLMSSTSPTNSTPECNLPVNGLRHGLEHIYPQPGSECWQRLCCTSFFCGISVGCILIGLKFDSSTGHRLDKGKTPYRHILYSIMVYTEFPVQSITLWSCSWKHFHSVRLILFLFCCCGFFEVTIGR